MRIKICGIRQPQDARAASEAGADLLGFNFYRPSPRYVGDGPVAELLDAVEPPAVPVAVTVNPTPAELDGLLSPGRRVGAAGFRLVQLHGDERPALADRLIARGVKVIKAFRVVSADFAGLVRAWAGKLRRREGLLAVLLDAAPTRPDQFGGTGRRFNWHWLAQARQAGQLDDLPPVLLAGGLTPDNVAEAIRVARPWGVDVASGVETETGEKSLDKIRDFIRNARTA